MTNNIAYQDNIAQVDCRFVMRYTFRELSYSAGALIIYVIIKIDFTKLSNFTGL